MDPESPPRYPTAMVNVTNRCTLRCAHCFVFRPGNPNAPAGEMSTEVMVATLDELRRRHGIQIMLWMGGEPLLRPDVLAAGTPLFLQNTVTTNGTLDLIDLPRCTYVVSVDGPPAINDAVRGKGTFARVMGTLARVPRGFAPTVMGQCVVTRKNEGALAELLRLLLPSGAQGLTFSFYVPTQHDRSGFAWETLEERDGAVREVLRLKAAYPDFVWNNRRALELTLAENARQVTANCPAQRLTLPLYLEGDRFVTPFCCYGNDVDCERCGAWVVFHMAAKLEQGGLIQDASLL